MNQAIPEIEDTIHRIKTFLYMSFRKSGNDVDIFNSFFVSINSAPLSEQPICGKFVKFETKTMSHEQLRIVSDVSVYKRTCIEELETKFNTKKARYLDDPSLESVPTTMLATENSSNSQYSLSLWKKNGGHERCFGFLQTSGRSAAAK